MLGTAEGLPAIVTIRKEISRAQYAGREETTGSKLVLDFCQRYSITVPQILAEAGPELASFRHPQKSRKQSVWRVVQTLC